MSIVLINPLDYVERFRYPVNRPPYDLLYVEAYLRSKGIEVFYFDIHNMKITESAFRRNLSTANVKYYLINTTGNGHHFQRFPTTGKHIKVIIKYIRENNPGSFIILSGESSTVYFKEYFSLNVDCILYDEPEYGLLEIITKGIEKTEELSDVRGVYYRKNELIVKTALRNSMKTLDELPPPRWGYVKEYLWDSIFKYHREYIDIVAMRGCPYNCTFCKSSLSNKVLYHSPQYILDQIKILHNDFGYRDFFIRDAGYFDDLDRCKKVCAELAKIGGIVWKCNARIDNMDSAKLKIMRQSGCSLIAYGVESGNDKTLSIVNKGVTVKRIKEVIAMTKEIGIRVAVYIIMDLPCEGFNDKIRSLHFAKTIKANIVNIAPYSDLKKFMMSNKLEKITNIAKMFLSMLFIVLFFWRREQVVYYCKIRIDSLSQNLKHYRIAQKKFHW